MNGINLFHFLVNIDEKEAFKKAFKIAPDLILDYAAFETGKESLIQTLTRGSDPELLLFVLEYMKKFGDEYLTTFIDDHKLVYLAIKNNNVNALRTIIQIAKSENKSESEIIKSNFKDETGNEITMLNIASNLGRTEITRMLEEKLTQDQRSPDETVAGVGVGGRAEEKAEEDGVGVGGRAEEEAEEDGAGVGLRAGGEAGEDGAGVGLRAGGQAEARVKIPIEPLETTTIQSLLEKKADCNFRDTARSNTLEIASQNLHIRVENLLNELTQNNLTLQPQNKAEVSPIARVEEAEVSPIAGAKSKVGAGTKEEIKTITPSPSPPQPPSSLSSPPSPPSPPSSPTSTPPSQQPPLNPEEIESPTTLTSKSHPGSLSKPSKEDASINKNLIIGGGALVGAGAGLCVSALTVGIVFSAPVVITVIAGATIGTLAGVAIGTIVEKIQVENVTKKNRSPPLNLM
jgi:hypothetical protein